MFALPFAYVGRLSRGGRLAGLERPALGDDRDGRRAHARDGAEPADRRRARRAKPSHREPRASERDADARAGAGAQRGRTRAVPGRRLPARPDRPLALADPGGDVRRLPVPQALHVALPFLARRLPRARAGRRLARRLRIAPRGRHGRWAQPCCSGSPASTSSTRSTTSSTIVAKACIRGRRGSASAASSTARARFTPGRSSCSRSSGLGLEVGPLVLGRRRRCGGAARVRAPDRRARRSSDAWTRRSSR